MIVKIKKRFAIGKFEEEEKWINEMSAKGLNLIDTNGITYTFQEGTPSEYIYRMEFLEKSPTHPESVKYLQFLEETGVEYVISLMKWIYLRKKKSDGEFALYSDLKSKLNHYRRIAHFIAILSALYMIPIFTNFISIIIHSYFGNTVGIITGIVCIIIMLGLCVIAQLTVLPVYQIISKLKRDIKIHE